MNEKEITLAVPVTHYCKCGWNNHTRRSVRCKCPDCGGKRIQYGARPIHHNRVSIIWGAYNLCRLNEEQPQYIFHLRPDAPKLPRRGISIPADDHFEIDGMSAVEVAERILEIYEGRYISTATKELPPLIEYLKGMEEKDERDKLRAEIQRLSDSLYWALGDLEDLEEEES